MGDYLIDQKSAQQHTLRSIEISKQMGESAHLGIPYANACYFMICLGQLNQAEQLIREFYSEYRHSGTRSDYYFQVVHTDLLLNRGEWKQVLALNRILREELRQGDFFQSISARNLDIATAVLELVCFGLMAKLAEAESALKENIEIGSRLLQSNFLLVEVYLRQNRMSAAHDQFALAQDGLSPAARDNNLYRVLRANAEIEFALADGHWEEAVEACKTSIEVYRDCGHRWGWGRTLIDLGDALIGRNESGDLERAKETYQQSLDMFSEMGAPGYIKVLEERLGDL